EAAWLRPLLLLEERPQGLRMWDAKGRPVPVPGAGSSVIPVVGRRTHTFDFEVPLLPRPRAPIGKVEGRLTAVGPTKMLTFAFDTLDRLHGAKPGAPLRTLRQEGVTCRVGKVVLAKERWTVHLTLDYPPGGTRLESFQAGLWVANNEMALVSEDGKRTLPSSSYYLEDSSARRAVLSYTFLDTGELKRGRPSDWRP